MMTSLRTMALAMTLAFSSTWLTTPAIAASQVASSIDAPLEIASRAAVIANANTGEVLYGKNMQEQLPIASITKLMTAMVVLDAHQDMDEMLTITQADVDRLRNTHSRLALGTRLSRADLMLLALMSSENRASSALIRHYPGGFAAGIAAMNRKARQLGMYHTRFVDGTGLNSNNISTPAELLKMVTEAEKYPYIRAFSTTSQHTVVVRGREQTFRNTNGLVKKPEWDIEVSKTGFLNEAGRCLVMFAKIRQTPVVMVLMDSVGKYTRIGDANRVKKALEVARI